MMKNPLLLKLMILALLTANTSAYAAAQGNKKIKSIPPSSKSATIRTMPLPEIVPTPNNGPEKGTTPHYPEAGEYHGVIGE